MTLLDIFFSPEKKSQEPEKRMPDIPEPLMKALLKYGKRITSIPNGRKDYPYDFED